MFSRDFKEFVKLLNQNHVEYLIVGGYAVGLHGFPRYTGDIDFWINNTEQNAAKMVNILSEFGFSSYNVKIEDFLNSENVIQLGYPPYRIDILLAVDGVNFEECYRNKFEKQIDDVSIDFIGREELIKNKKSTGRPKDIIDLENLDSTS
jgi:hypothetical protein